MEAEDKQPQVDLIKQDSSIMADPSPNEENSSIPVRQPDPPEQEVPDTDMKEEIKLKEWAKDPISDIFKGRVKQIITFQGSDGHPKQKEKVIDSFAAILVRVVGFKEIY